MAHSLTKIIKLGTQLLPPRRLCFDLLLKYIQLITLLLGMIKSRMSQMFVNCTS